MAVQLIQNLVWILLSGESMNPLKPFEWIWMVVQLATNTVQMISPCVYKTNGHFWKWKFWMVSNGLSVEGLNKSKPILHKTSSEISGCNSKQIISWTSWKLWYNKDHKNGRFRFRNIVFVYTFCGFENVNKFIFVYTCKCPNATQDSRFDSNTSPVKWITSPGLWKALMKLKHHLVHKVLNVAPLGTSDKHQPVVGESLRSRFISDIGPMAELQFNLDTLRGMGENK